MGENNRDNHFWDSLLTFMAGAAAGFIAGILFAPASGKETRKKIKDQAVKTGEAAKEGYEKITKEAEKRTSTHRSHFTKVRARFCESGFEYQKTYRSRLQLACSRTCWM